MIDIKALPQTSPCLFTCNIRSTNVQHHPFDGLATSQPKRRLIIFSSAYTLLAATKLGKG
uniref:Uncharacterized protein n=1 Tax=Arundo donax TaxID=35708 RepID=A0A0A9G3E0_ARUDO